MKDIKGTIIGDTVLISLKDFKRLAKIAGYIATVDHYLDPEKKVVKKDKKKNVK
jgi:hypothetical protein